MTKHKLCALIIESDPKSLNHITKLLQRNSLISEIDTAIDSDQALLKIIDSNPDIVLLEYPTAGKTGKELIKYIKTKLTETTIIFVSKTKEYAADAIQNEIYNYLLKPVTKINLGIIINKVQLIKQTNIQSRINQIIEETPEKTRIKFQTTKGYVLIDPEEILYCQSNKFYTEIYLTNSRVELSYLFLSKIEEILARFNFLRISRSNLINMKYVRKIFRNTNTIVLSSDGKEYMVKGAKLQIRNLGKLDNE